jgi:hypothetical protein
MQVTLRASTLLVGLLLCFQGTAKGGLILLPESDPESPATHALSWETHSGRFYLLEESTDLETWTSGEEEPAEGTGESSGIPSPLRMARGFSACL